MWLFDIYSISSQIVNDSQVLLEHIRVLVISGRDILLYGGRKGYAMSFAKGQREDITTLLLVIRTLYREARHLN